MSTIRSTHRFDWDEATHLRSLGWTLTRLAAHFGVSGHAIAYATDPAFRARAQARTAARLASGVCVDCGGPCNRYGPRCHACYPLALATSVRPDDLLCQGCKRWLPDHEFPLNRSKPARRGHHGSCRACQTIQRRAYRDRNKQPCLSCGRPRSHPREARTRDSGLCSPCYIASITGTAA